MTSTIFNDFDYAELAQAAYSNLNATMDTGLYVAALEQTTVAGMSEVQATKFAQAYHIIGQSPFNDNQRGQHRNTVH